MLMSSSHPIGIAYIASWPVTASAPSAAIPLRDPRTAREKRHGDMRAAIAGDRAVLLPVGRRRKPTLSRLTFMGHQASRLLRPRKFYDLRLASDSQRDNITQTALCFPRNFAHDFVLFIELK